MKYPTSTETKNKIKKVIDAGWLGEDNELENILHQNEPCIREFQKGRPIKNCDFDFGKKYEYLLERKPPPMPKLLELSKLLLLKGKYLEKQGKPAKAMDIYLSVLTLSRHTAQNPLFGSRIPALAISKNACTAIKSCLEIHRLDKKVFRDTLRYLKDYQKNLFPVRELIEAEKKSYLSNIKLLSDGLEEKIKKDPRRDEANKKTALEFLARGFKQANQLADTYYGYFIKAAETNEDSDWAFAAVELEKLKEYKKTPDEFSEKLFKNILYMHTVNFKTAARKYYYPNQHKLRELISLSAAKTR